MKVRKLLDQSSKSVEVVIRVDSGEIADIEEMARLADGEGGHFGYLVEIIKIGDPEPIYSEKSHFGKHLGFSVERQFGYAEKPTRDDVRYYRVSVYRD